MKKSEFKEKLNQLFDRDIDDFSLEEKYSFIQKVFIDYQIDKDKTTRIATNKGQKWTDEELKLILSVAPSKENCLRFARLFGRGYGSIEQIYRWASTPQKELSPKRENDSFIQQVFRVKKCLGLRN